MIRGDSTQKKIALVFTGHEFSDGGDFIANALEKENIKASFFFTGQFYKTNHDLVGRLIKEGHFLGNHSNAHYLCCSWNDRDSMFIDKDYFISDMVSLDENFILIDKEFGNHAWKNSRKYFLPPYEWYNDSLSNWARELGYQLVNLTPGTLSHADYTVPGEKNYRSSSVIYQSILDFEKRSPSGLNGFILLMHTGTDPKRTDKFYFKLPQLIQWLKTRGYDLVKLDDLGDRS